MNSDCMNPQCNSKVAETYLVRGLCKGCYAKALRLVRDGVTTWERLELEGKTRPANRQGGHNITPEAYALKPDIPRGKVKALLDAINAVWDDGDGIHEVRKLADKLMYEHKL